MLFVSFFFCDKIIFISLIAFLIFISYSYFYILVWCHSIWLLRMWVGYNKNTKLKRTGKLKIFDTTVQNICNFFIFPPFYSPRRNGRFLLFELGIYFKQSKKAVEIPHRIVHKDLEFLQFLWGQLHFILLKTYNKFAKQQIPIWLIEYS